MIYRNRFITDKIQRYLQYFPVVVLTGARQVGKSTLLKHLLGETHEVVVFDPVMDIENARKEPELFFQNHTGPLVLDEIQYAPELVPVIKRLVDEEKEPGKYVITGSQQWGVLQTISESLAGRAVLLHLMGYHLPEASSAPIQERWIEGVIHRGRIDKLPQKRFSLPTTLLNQLYRGQLPGVQELPIDVVPGYLDSYIRTYIERDVRLMAEISDMQMFGRFFRLCGALSAQEINFNQLGRDIGVTPQTAKRWIDILRMTFQWIELPAYSGNTIKRVSGRPKGFFPDTGLLCNSLFLSTPEALPSHPQWGSIIETYIVLDIIKTLTTMQPGAGIYHWRSHGGAEVDMVLEQNGVFIPIEIKSTTRPSRKDTLGIRAFRDTYPHLEIGDGIVVHLGTNNYKLSDNETAIAYSDL